VKRPARPPRTEGHQPSGPATPPPPPRGASSAQPPRPCPATAPPGTVIRTSYDPSADALHIHFAAPGTIAATTHEAAPGVLLDYDATGRLIGVELLDVTNRRGGEAAAGSSSG
jgi:uncharacterized protein YuzE